MSSLPPDNPDKNSDKNAGKNTAASVFVLKSVVPPMGEYQAQLNDIWASRQFTNAGPKHAQLKSELCNFLDVPYCVLVGNGTFSLMAALAALGVENGEVITTPYTFVASSHCLKPFNLKPRFVDIESDSLTIDPKLVEAAITPETKAIMAVHVYGNPCAIEELQDIATRHNLKLIYDAAHAFGVTYKGRSIFTYGDASSVSFHATKAFHTFEGGAVFSNDPEICDYVRRYRNFGIDNKGTVIQHGLNTKMSELHAAAGIVNLAHYQEHVDLRAALYKRYQKALQDVEGLSFVSYERQENPNYNYCPILIEKGRDALFESLAQNGIYTRKYFHPLLTDMPAFAEYKQHFPVASRVVDQVLCLPIYSDLTPEEQDRVIDTIKNFKGI